MCARPILRLTLAVAVGAGGLAAAGCGRAVPPPATTRPDPAPARAAVRAGGPPAPAPSCVRVVGDVMGQVAERLYGEAVNSDVVRTAERLVARSTPLLSAVLRHDPAATQSAAEALVATGHMARLRVDDGVEVLADAGAGQAIAPQVGVLRDGQGHPIGHYDLSTQSEHDFVSGVAGLTSGLAVLHGARGTEPASSLRPGGAPLPDDGPARVKGRAFEAFSFRGAAYPSGPLRITVLLPRAGISRYCRAGTDATEAAVIADVGRRIYASEQSGGPTRVAVRRVAGDRQLLRAVLAGDPLATRRAVVALLNHHIVRIRVLQGASVLADVGGPLVLAPVTGTLRVGSITVGRFVLSIQDDLGYLLLAHRLAGVDVVERAGTRQLIGTLQPGPRSIPEHGEVSWGGRAFQAVSFPAERFPSGVMRISLLLAAGQPG